MYYYHSWGLSIASFLPCSGWPLEPDMKRELSADICIEAGKVPKQLAQPTLKRALLQVDHQHALMILPGIARVLVSGGKDIIIQATPPLGHEPDTVALQLLLETNAIPALLIQRGLLVLSGAAIAIGGRAIAILGPTGTGTSTLAAALALQGAEVLADGYCVINVVTGNPQIFPGPAQLNLWGQALKWLEHPEMAATCLRPGQQRFRATFPAPASAEPKPLQALWYLAKQHDHEATLTGKNAIQTGLKLRHNPFIAQGCGHAGTELIALRSVLKNVPLQRVNRPDSLMKVAELLECRLKERL